MSVLSDELAADPLGLGYAQWEPDAPGMVVQLLTAMTQQMPKPTMMTERGVLAHYVDGPVAADAVMTKLDTYASGSQSLSSVVKRAMRLLGNDGIDMGSAATRSMLDALQADGVITADECTKLKALGIQPASRAEVLGITVTEADVRAAWQA